MRGVEKRQSTSRMGTLLGRLRADRRARTESLAVTAGRREQAARTTHPAAFPRGRPGEHKPRSVHPTNHSEAIMSVAEEVYIGSVDIWRLHHFNWPFQRVVARHAVDHLELTRYMQDLLSTRRWDSVRAIPHRGDDGSQSQHVYDIFGHPRQPTT
jgi:hypothetical protein